MATNEKNAQTHNKSLRNTNEPNDRYFLQLMFAHDSRIKFYVMLIFVCAISYFSTKINYSLLHNS